MFYVFDAYGTLVELDNFQGRLHRALAGRGFHADEEAVARAARREMRYYMGQAVRATDEASYLQLRGECAEVLRNGLVELAGDAPEVTDIEGALAEAIVFRPFPEVADVLQELGARGVRMGVASNWDYALPEHLAALGLHKYFRFILTSAEVGEAKPAPAFYATVRDRVRQIAPDETDMLYVGDHYENDVLPARAAGFRTCWLVRSRRDVASGEMPECGSEVSVSSLVELL